MTIAGVTMNACASAPGCDTFNGIFTLSLGFPSTRCTSCGWCWEGGIVDASCGTGLGTTWMLTFNGALTRWELATVGGGGTDALYTIPAANWQCNLANVLTRTSNGNACTGWPATITVTPSGPETGCNCQAQD